MNSTGITFLNQKKAFFKKSASFNQYGGLLLIVVGIVFLVINVHLLYGLHSFGKELNDSEIYFSPVGGNKSPNSVALHELAAINQMLLGNSLSDGFVKLLFFATVSLLFAVIGVILRQNFLSFQTMAEILEEIELTV